VEPDRGKGMLNKWIQREEVSQPAMVRNSWLKMVMLKAFSHDFWSKEIQLALDLRKIRVFSD